MKYREPAVAGRFYPACANQLSGELNSFFATLPCPDKIPKALIVPHAGYYYSGAVAAHAFATIKAVADDIQRVILLGPSHRCYLQGCAVPSHDIFVTPLGDINIDKANCKKLIELGLAKEFDQAHQQEHSLEVQLPFLQHCLKDFELLPIVVGSTQPKEVSNVLTALADLPNTLLVISTDLSHFHPYHEAQQLDARTIERILDYDDTLLGEDACGCHAVNGLLRYSKDKGWQNTLVKHANSGDITPDNNNAKQEVVGYASFVMY